VDSDPVCRKAVWLLVSQNDYHISLIWYTIDTLRAEAWDALFDYLLVRMHVLTTLDSPKRRKTMYRMK
jgi:hypothetical protein